MYRKNDSTRRHQVIPDIMQRVSKSNIEQFVLIVCMGA